MFKFFNIFTWKKNKKKKRTLDDRMLRVLVFERAHFWFTYRIKR